MAKSIHAALVSPGAGRGADSSGEAGEQGEDPGEMVRVNHRGPDGGSH